MHNNDWKEFTHSFEELDKMIKDAYIQHEIHEKQTEHKSITGDSTWKEIIRTRSLIQWKHVCNINGINLKYGWLNWNCGLILLNDKFIISLTNNKWRVSGKNIWYRFKTPEQFVSKYIKCDYEEDNGIQVNYKNGECDWE